MYENVTWIPRDIYEIDRGIVFYYFFALKNFRNRMLVNYPGMLIVIVAYSYML